MFCILQSVFCSLIHSHLYPNKSNPGDIFVQVTSLFTFCQVMWLIESTPLNTNDVEAQTSIHCFHHWLCHRPLLNTTNSAFICTRLTVAHQQFKYISSINIFRVFFFEYTCLLLLATFTNLKQIALGLTHLWWSFSFLSPFWKPRTQNKNCP